MANINDKLRSAFRMTEEEDYDNDEYEDEDEYEEEDEEETEEDEYEEELLKEEKTERVPASKASKVYSESKEKRKRRNIFLGFLYGIITIAAVLCILFFLKNTRSDKEAFREKGIECYKAGEYDNAMKYFHDSISETQWFSANMDIDTTLYIAACHIQKKEFESAIGLYDTILSTGTGRFAKDDIVRLKYLAEALMDVSSGNLTEDNVEALKIAADSGDTGMYLYVAAFYASQDDSEKMLEFIDKYLADNPMNTYCSYELSSYYLKQGNMDKAKVTIDKGLSAPDDFFLDSVKFNEAIYYEKLGDMENALSIVTELHEKFPDNVEYKSEYDFLYTRLNVDPDPVHKESDDYE